MKKGLQNLFAKGLLTLLCVFVPFVASFAQEEATPTECASIAAFKAIEGANVNVIFTDTLTVAFHFGYDGCVLFDETGYLKAEGSISYETLESGTQIINLAATANYYGMFPCYVSSFNVAEGKVAVDFKKVTIAELNTKGVAEYAYVPVALENVEIYNKIDTLKDQQIGETTNPDWTTTPILGDKIVISKYLVSGTDTLAIGGEGNYPSVKSCTVKGYLEEVVIGYDETTDTPIMGVRFNITETEGLAQEFTNLPIYKGYDDAAFYYFKNGADSLTFKVDYGVKVPSIAKTFKGYKVISVKETSWNSDDWMSSKTIYSLAEEWVVTEMTYDNLTYENLAIYPVKQGTSWAYAFKNAEGEEVLLKMSGNIPATAKTLEGFMGFASTRVGNTYPAAFEASKATFDTVEYKAVSTYYKEYKNQYGSTNSFSVFKNGDVEMPIKEATKVYIPAEGDIKGYVCYSSSASSSWGAETPFFQLTESNVTKYRTLADVETMVNAANDSIKALDHASVSSFIVNLVFKNADNSGVLYVTEKSFEATGYASTKYYAIKVANVGNIASGDEITGFNGKFTKYQSTDPYNGNYFTLAEGATLSVVSSGNAIATPSTLSNSYFKNYFVKPNRGYTYGAQYYQTDLMDNVATQIVVHDDVAYFKWNTDSIMLVGANGFDVKQYAGQKVAFRAIYDYFVCGTNSPALIIRGAQDVFGASLEVATLKELTSMGKLPAGVTPKFTGDVRVNYIEKTYEVRPNHDVILDSVGSVDDWACQNWGECDTIWEYTYQMDSIPQYEAYVQDSTDAIYVRISNPKTAINIGDSIRGGLFGQYYVGYDANQYNIYIEQMILDTACVSNLKVVATTTELSAKDITLAEYLKLQATNELNGHRVHFSNLQYGTMYRDVEITSGNFVTKLNYFFAQDGDTIFIVEGDDVENFRIKDFNWYPYCDITVIVDNRTFAADYAFFPVSQNDIVDVTPEGASLATIVTKTASEGVSYSGTAVATFQTERGLLIQDGTAAVLLEGLDSVAVGATVGLSNIQGTYFPADDECMARIVPTSYELTRGRLQKRQVALDSLVANPRKYEGEIVDIYPFKTQRIAKGQYTTMTSDSTIVPVLGYDSINNVVPADARVGALTYRIAADQEFDITVVSYETYNPGSSQRIVFNEFVDYMNYWQNTKGQSYVRSGFMSPVLVNNVFPGGDGTVFNVQDTDENGNVLSLSVNAMVVNDSIDFQVGDSIFNIQGGYMSYEDLSASYGAEGYARGRQISAYRYDYHVGDIDYPTDVDSIETEEGDKVLPDIVELQLGTLIQKLNAGNELSYSEPDSTIVFNDPKAVKYQGQNFQVTGIVSVETTGETTSEYITIGDEKVLLSGFSLAKFVGKEVTVKGNFDIGFAITDKVSFNVIKGADVVIDSLVVDNIAEFKQWAHPTAVVTIAGEVAVTHKNGYNVYVQDETGALLLYARDYTDSVFVNGDRLTGISGIYTVYQQIIPEMKEVKLPAPVKGAEVLPTLRTVEQLGNCMSEYVVLHNVQVANDTTLANKKTVKFVNPENTEVTIYNESGNAVELKGKTTYSVVGVVTAYKGALQISYIKHEAYSAPVAPVAPVINPENGEINDTVAISCETENTDIFYRLTYLVTDSIGEYQLYTEEFVVDVPVKVEAYAELIGVVDYKGDAVRSEIVEARFSLPSVVRFENIAAVYAKGQWEELRYKDYTSYTTLAIVESQPTVVDVIQTAGMMGGMTNNYYLNDGTGVIVLQGPASGEDWMGNPVEGLELEIGKKLPAEWYATIDFKCVVDDETYLPTGEVYGAPVMNFMPAVLGVDEDGMDITESYADFAKRLEASDLKEEAIDATISEINADPIKFAGKLLNVDTVANYYGAASMMIPDAIDAYLFWDAEEAFEITSDTIDDVTNVYVNPLYNEAQNDFAGALFNLKGVDVIAASLEDSVTAEIAVARFDWNSIAMGRTLIAKEGFKLNTGDDNNLDNNFEDNANIYSNNGAVYVETEAGAMIEVYTVNGLRVYAGVSNTTTTIINGLNTNVAIIRVNGQAYKVFVK
ncbi:MAG: hypothetical protein J6A44_05625 [Paludibacteraceae bacterium]|nr:hypothetical protein [Paludibacteraceae bacterium]